jgi:hypothetical protein
MMETTRTCVILNALRMLFNLSVHIHLIYQKPSAKSKSGIEVNDSSSFFCNLFIDASSHICCYFTFATPFSSSHVTGVGVGAVAALDVAESVYQMHVSLVRLLNLMLASLVEKKVTHGPVWGAALSVLLFLICEEGEVNKQLYVMNRVM